MKTFTLLSFASLLLFLNFSAYGQENITIITNDDNDDDIGFFAFMPEMPAFSDFGDMDMATGFGWAEDGEMNLPSPPDMKDPLNLTKDQTDKIKKIQNTAKKQNIPLKSDIQVKEMELKDLMDTESPDRNAVAVKVKEIDALRTQITLNKMNARIDCRNILTKEQKDKMDQMRTQRRMMHFDHGNRKVKFKREMRCE